MLTRLIAASPIPSGSGTFQMRQQLNTREHFWRGNARELADLTSVENLTGTAYDDQLTGDGGANTINGDAGNDTLSYTGGFDALNGGSGTDTVSFSGFGSAVWVDLTY